MTTGLTGLPTIAWDQTRINGQANAAVSAVRPGAIWSWSGAINRADAATSLAAFATPANEDASLRARAAGRGRRIGAMVADERTLGSDPKARPAAAPAWHDRAAEAPTFVVADSERYYTIRFLPSHNPDRPGLIFADGTPPPAKSLVVLSVRGPLAGAWRYRGV